MAKRDNSQIQQVISAMRNNGGYALLGNLYKVLDFSTWGTETPEATVRRIVQENQAFFKIDRGLWALTECRESVLKQLELEGFDAESPSEEAKEKTQKFTHSFYQGLIVEIGNMYGEKTFVPNSDRNKMFLDKPLKDVVTLANIYEFTHNNIVDKAKNVDVVWFGEQNLPSAFCEVEHTTDFKNSLLKFLGLQGFYTPFYIVAEENKRRKFDALLDDPTFKPLRGRVTFRNYENLVLQHEKMCELARIETITPGNKK